MGSLIYILIIGAIAGWLAGKILKGSGFGIFGNIIIGIIGSVVGWLISSILHIRFLDGFIGEIILAVIGAIIFLWVYGKLTEKKTAESE